MRRLDGVYAIVNHPAIRRQAGRFGGLILVIALLFGLATSSVWPATTRGQTGSASANRLWTSGAELNSLTADVEVSGSSGTTPSVQNGTVRSGSRAYQTDTSSNTATIYKTWASSGQSSAFWFRTYLNVKTLPGATTGIFQVGSGATAEIGVRLTTAGKLQLFNETGTPAQIGSDSSTLVSGIWYRVEVKVDNTTSTATKAELRLDGVSQASTTSTNIGTSVTIDRLTWGVLTSTSASFFFDDLAINGNSNRTDNYPGDGKVVVQRPASIGDNNAWTGNGHCLIDNSGCINEITPNDSTNYLSSTTAGQLADFGVTSSASAGITSGDFIKLVAVEARYTRNAASAGDTFKVRGKASAGGTTTEGTAVTDTVTSYNTNVSSTDHLAQLTLYSPPGSTAQWTTTNLDNAQIGINNVTNSTGTLVTALWLTVEYAPNAGGRLWSSGFELNTTTAGVEWTSVTGSPTVQGTTVRSGAAALQSAASGAQSFLEYNFQSANANGPFFVRAYVYISSANSAEFSILELRDTSDTRRAYVTLTSSNTLKLFDDVGQIGSASAALSTSTWYRLEIQFDRTAASGSQTVSARVDGLAFASSTTRTLGSGVARLALGNNIANAGATTGQLLFDDVAINQNIGASQNSWPGEGKIVHLKPNNTGDNSGWTCSGVCLGANHSSMVNETTPNDATNFIKTTTTGARDDHALADPTFGTLDTVTLVEVGVRFRSNAGTEGDFRVRTLDATGGVPIESATVAATSTTWATNAAAEPRNYPITAYTRPEQNTSYTKTDLTNSQAGVRYVAGSGQVDVSTFWLLVEIAPSLSGTVYQPDETTGETSAPTVALKDNGAGSSTAIASSASGFYAIYGATMTQGDPLVVYLDTGGGVNGATDTVASGAALSGYDIYRNRLTTRCDNGCSLTNTNIDSFDKGNDSDIHATVTSSNLTVDNDWKLLVKANTFAPGGTVTTLPSGSNSYSGDLEIKAGATLTMGANALSVGGSFTNGGTFTTPSNTTTLTSTDATETIQSNGSSFNNLELNSGLTGYWKLDEGTGSSAIDASGSGFTGTIANSPSYTTAVPGAGYFGADPGSLTFVRASSQGITATPSTTLSGSYTVGAWIRPASTQAISIFGTRGPNDFSFDIKVLNGNTIHADIGDGAGWITTSINASFSYSVGTWYHIAIAVTPTGYTVYANGTSVDSGSYASSTPLLYDTNHNIFIGKCCTSAEYFDGEIDDVRVYNRALGSGEITDLAAGNHPTVATFTLQDSLSVAGNLGVRTGKLDVSSSNFGVTVTGNYLNVANLNARAGAVTLNAGSSKTVQADPPFYDLTASNGSGTWTLDRQRLSVSNNLAITSGTLDATAGGCYASSSCAISIGGSYSNGGTFTARTGTVTLTATTGSKTLSGTMTGGSAFYNLIFNGSGGGWSFGANSATVGNDLTITAGTVTAPSSTLTVSHNYSNSGTFTHNSGAVSLNGSGQQTLAGTMTGSSSFYNLTVSNSSGTNPSDCELTSFVPDIVFNAASATIANTLTATTASTRIQFATTKTYTIANINWNGQASGTKIYFRNSLASGSWNLAVSGSQTAVSYVNVSRSNASTGNTIQAADGTNVDCGNNTNWSFNNPDSPTSLAQKKVTGGATISTGGWTNETQVQFTALATDPDNSGSVQLCVEKDLLGTGFSNAEDQCGSLVAYSGSAVAVSVTITGQTDASEYHWQARVKDSGSYYSSWVSYGGNAESARDYGVDTTACATTTVYDGTSTGVDATYNDGALDSLSANWDSFNCSAAGLNFYEYSIGTTAGGTDVVNWTNNTTLVAVTASSLNLHTNQHYFFNVRATDNAGNLSAVASSNGQDVLPTISFSLSGNTITFSDLAASNDRSDTKTVSFTTSTNAFGGYIVTQYAGGLLTGDGHTLPMFQGGSYASPAAWGALPCTTGTNCGYGYTSNDTTIQGSNKFGGGTLYAPFSLTASGDVVADHTATVNGTSGAVTNESFTITHKVAASQFSAPVTYQGTVIYIVTGTF